MGPNWERNRRLRLESLVKWYTLGKMAEHHLDALRLVGFLQRRIHRLRRKYAALHRVVRAQRSCDAVSEREAVRERVREAVAAVLERDATLAVRRDFGPLVDCLADAACDAAGLPAIRPVTLTGGAT